MTLYLGNGAFDVFIESAPACISLLIFLLLNYVVTAVVCMRFMFCFMCAVFVRFDAGGVFVVGECGCFFCLGVVCFLSDL